MKKTIILTFVAIACLCACISCSGDETLENMSSTESEVTSRSSSDEELQFIDFVDDESFDSQTIVIEVAAERLDKYVSFTGERYVMAPCTPQEVGLSQRVFDYMQGRMEKQNERVDTFKDKISINGKSFIYSDIEYIPPRITSRTETGQTGGFTGVQFEDTWYGCYVYIYLSKSTLESAGDAFTAAEIIAVKIPDPKVQAAVAIACGFSALTCNYLARNYPNGVKISILYTVVTGCIPYSLTSQ